MNESQVICNVYHLLLEYRNYYQAIRPALEKMILTWNSNGSEAAWNVFEKEIGTHEATMLATVMKDVEQTSPAKALHTLTQKQEQFANAN
jgi:hypothetical protein